MMILDYIIVIMVELTLKNSGRNIYKHVYLKKLPNMVSPITKLTLQLNLCQKTSPGGI